MTQQQEKPIKLNRIAEILAREQANAVDICKALKISETSFSKWRKNTRQPKLEYLFKIAAYLKIDVREFLLEENPFKTTKADANEQ